MQIPGLIQQTFASIVIRLKYLITLTKINELELFAKPKRFLMKHFIKYVMSANEPMPGLMRFETNSLHGKGLILLAFPVILLRKL